MTQTVERTSMQIEYRYLHELTPHPDAEAIPMSKEDEQALRDGIANDGIKTPLHITSDGLILDGVHRWRIAKELLISKVPVIVYHYEHKAEESIHTINANLQRRHINEGQRALLFLELESLQQELEKQRQEALERRLSRDAETGRFVPLLPQGSNGSQEQGEAVAKVAKKKGTSARTMYRAKAVSKDKKRTEAVKKGKMSLNKAYQEVKAEEKANEVKQAIMDERPLTDIEIMATLGIDVQPYDVWNFPACDNRFGHDYPGRIPGQLVAHCLYFWTEQGDTVLDPMAGSGTTIDVCNVLNRRVLAYDAHPCRDDIKLHNIAEQGWPDGTAEAKLIFWDPPYFKKVDNGYGDQSISRFGRAEYLDFFERMAAIIPGTFHGRLAFLMSNYTDEENLTGSIWLHDYIKRFTAYGWQVERIIQTPLSTQQVHPDIVKKFRESKRLAYLSRELVVMAR